MDFWKFRRRLQKRA